MVESEVPGRLAGLGLAYEDFAEGQPDRLHARAYLAMLAAHEVPLSTVSIYADPGCANSPESDRLMIA